MKSKLIAYSNLNNQHKLIDIIPLSTPLSLMIDPINACNFRCIFCPTGHPELISHFKRPIGKMKYILFCKIIDDLNFFPKKIEKINLYKDGEPLLNPKIGKMIYYAKKRNVAHSIETTTNGSLLTLEKSKELIQSGLDRIRISINHVNDDGYKHITKTFSDYSRLLKNVENFYTEKIKQNSELHVHVKLIDTGLSDNEKKKFLIDFKELSDSIHIDELMGWSISSIYDFTLNRKPKYSMNRCVTLNKKIIVCPQPFYTLSINFNGKISVCCVDWTMKTIIGDSNHERLDCVWNGYKINSFRLMQINGERNKNIACQDCQYIFGSSKNSLIDNFTSVLKERFNN